MRYWVCQECKEGHVNSDVKPARCPDCGVVGGSWKWSEVGNMKSFRMYICTKCELRTVEERQPPTYKCDYCGARNWRVFNGYNSK